MTVKNKTSRFIIPAFAIIIGLYPLIYAFVDMHNKGLLQSKPSELLVNPIWKTFFYVHIAFGGLALFIGWVQFSKKIRNRYLNFHRLLGRVYIAAVILSSIAGIYIAFFASGGIVSVLGFSTLALCWFCTGVMGYASIRKRDIRSHTKWMIRNYALTFAAVTLRIWLPLMMLPFFHLGFLLAYPTVVDP